MSDWHERSISNMHAPTSWKVTTAADSRVFRSKRAAVRWAREQSDNGTKKVRLWKHIPADVD